LGLFGFFKSVLNKNIKNIYLKKNPWLLYTMILKLQKQLQRAIFVPQIVPLDCPGSLRTPRTGGFMNSQPCQDKPDYPRAQVAPGAQAVPVLLVGTSAQQWQEQVFSCGGFCACSNAKCQVLPLVFFKKILSRGKELSSRALQNG